MAENVSELTTKCRKVSNISALIVKNLRKGCLCTIHSNSFAQLIKLTFELIDSEKIDKLKIEKNVDNFNADERQTLGQEKVATLKIDERHTIDQEKIDTLENDDRQALNQALLSALSCFRRLVKAFVQLEEPANEDHSGMVCKQFHDWIIILVRLKFDFLGGLSRLWPHTSHNPNLRHLTEYTFNLILSCLPCPSNLKSGDNCRKTCHKVVENYAQLKVQNEDLGTGFFYSVFCLLDKELNEPKNQGSIQFDCRSSRIRVKCSARVHFHSVKQFATNELKQNWKIRIERSTLATESTEVNVRRMEVLNLWKSLVSVSSNLGYSQSKEFVMASSKLVPSLMLDTCHLVKQKELDILNEVLCYGTTLGIQSTIPCEVSDLAQALLRQARTVSFIEIKIPMVFPGFGGNQIMAVENEDEDLELEEAPSLCAMQGIVLLHLKASALVVREAQCCSSSDSSASDSSLSSHGSSTLGEAEHEMKLIERNVMDILGRLRTWIIEQLELHSTSQLSQCIIVLFNEQDDALIESLLCLLDIFTGLHFGVYSFRHQLVTLEVDPTEVSSLQEALDPIEAFDNFLQNISNDSSVVLDFLVSNETCFLLYFLRLLKYMAKASRLENERSSVFEVLKKVYISIKKLTQKSLFPYEITPVVRQLEKLLNPSRSILNNQTILN